LADKEMGKWAVRGAIIGVIIFGGMIGYYLLNTPHYTDTQKLELNAGFAPNCTACLVKENTTCTADTLQYSQWGIICEQKYIKNCTAKCRRV